MVSRIFVGKWGQHENKEKDGESKNNCSGLIVDFWCVKCHFCSIIYMCLQIAMMRTNMGALGSWQGMGAGLLIMSLIIYS